MVGMLVSSDRAHQETRGCLFDFCANKPDYAFKIRTADVCPDCLNFLHVRLGQPGLDHVLTLLERVRLVALGRDADATGERSAAEAVDREYPFPIAYCFRSMQVELSYSRK